MWCSGLKKSLAQKTDGELIASSMSTLARTWRLQKLCCNQTASLAPIRVPIQTIAATMPQEEVLQFGGQPALGRPGQPEELASAYVYLASNDSAFTTGSLLEVSGGIVSVG